MYYTSRKSHLRNCLLQYLTGHSWCFLLSLLTIFHFRSLSTFSSATYLSLLVILHWRLLYGFSALDTSWSVLCIWSLVWSWSSLIVALLVWRRSNTSNISRCTVAATSCSDTKDAAFMEGDLHSVFLLDINVVEEGSLIMLRCLVLPLFLYQKP